ncbi:hypothetical protein MPH_09845 [Macrophomina phaseolina MS6]|uniref:DnaJ homologue subfamily C member 28 conserved domain-containing protein n=1 Tax=Macrophomina phaseolina (strain MS6) TaxID=1126212 RepID=K2S831_MACPH|nr:hypothetical protein MPH_09845 [Macrophomina phaseolina MS6]
MPAPYVCPSCLRAAQRSLPRTAASTLPQSPPARRWLSASPRLRREPPPPASSSPATEENHAEGSNASSSASRREPPQPQPDHHNGNATTAAAAANPAQQCELNKATDESEQGAMTRRLESLTEEGLLASPGRASSAIIEDAGFSEELRRKLEQRIAAASFKSDFAREMAVAELPASAGKGTRDVAGAAAWRGEESVGDAALRMLDDSVGRARGKALGPSVRPPTRVDTGMRASAARGENRGARLAGAREGASLYAAQKEGGMSDEERERFRREMKERFAGPGARGGAMSVRALESLANERIEDAIARGQFRNIKRGGELERDYNASNPFLDTTEYFMNKIIQKQEIVPPWIEKQQELVTAATRFRTRLRADWKRHAARMIASKGGSLEVQMRRAQAYAEAERLSNPKARKEEKINAVDEDGHLSQITLAGELKVASAPGTRDNAEHSDEMITVTAAPVGSTDGESTGTSPQAASEEVVAEVTTSATQSSPLPHQQMPVPAAPQPFRDPTWERTERSFLELSISSLNALTRSYNLMAPELAKKPYFALDRELASAYADVAPLLAAEIRDRALEPKAKVGPSQGHKVGGVLERFGTKQEVRVWDERGRKYGFKEFWRDLFAKE